MTIEYIPNNLKHIIDSPYKQASFKKREANLSCTCGEIDGTHTVYEANLIALKHNQGHPEHQITVSEISCGSLSF